MSCNINSLEWANWLNTISTTPSHEKVYTDRFGNKSLSFGEKNSFKKRYLSSNEIINISKKILVENKKSKTLSIEDQRKILRGMYHIINSKEEKFKKLYWFSRLFAKITGRKKELENQRKETVSLHTRVNIDESLQKYKDKQELKAAAEQKAAEQFKRDCALFNCNEAEMKELYLKREAKGLPPSVAAAIENIWLELLKTKYEENQEAIIRTDLFEDGRQVIFIPKADQGGVYIKEAFLNSGTFKNVFLVTSYFENRKLALLESKKENENDKDLKGNTEKKVKFEGTEKKDNSIHTFIPAAPKAVVVIGKKNDETDLDSGSVVIGTVKESTVVEGTIIEGSVVVQKKKKKKKKKKSELDQLLKKGHELANEKPIEILDPEAERINEMGDFEKEIYFSNLFKGKEGLLQAYQMTTINGQKSMIVELAGYDAKTLEGDSAMFTPKSGKKHLPLDLSQMKGLVGGRQLCLNDQCVYLNMIKDFLYGVQIMHGEGIIHRDLKPENVLCSSTGQGKIADFGTNIYNMVKNNKGVLVHNPKKAGISGTANYISPEIARTQTNRASFENVTTKADIWSIGMMLCELLSEDGVGSHPASLTKKQSQVLFKLAVKEKNLETLEQSFWHHLWAKKALPWGSYDLNKISHRTEFSEICNFIIHIKTPKDKLETLSIFDEIEKKKEILFYDDAASTRELRVSDQKDSAQKQTEKTKKVDKEDNEYWSRLVKLITEPKSASTEYFEKSFPKPKDEESILYLIWICTRPNPNERPKIAEVIKMFERWSEKAKKDLIEENEKDKEDPTFIQDLYRREVIAVQSQV